ncbi:hypothetical protein [Vacuolonema iberomarrocanum]|uniref:hypothetical protein n=1 Tax=Vacuolonema iberomarrocanum TaxID=3454632 RepID=UPI0019F1828A|nr:hypothetical protein [filamentous cyanobacterium LEGE 07170]
MRQGSDDIGKQISAAAQLLAMAAEAAGRPIVFAHHADFKKEMQQYPAMEVRPDCKAIVCAFAPTSPEQAQRFIDYLVAFFEKEVEL